MNEPEKIIMIDVDHQMPGHVIIKKEHWNEIVELLIDGGAKIVHTHNDTIHTYNEPEISEWPGDIGC